MKNKFINFLKNNYLYLTTFLLSTILIVIIFIMNNVTPFGKNSLLCVDFYHQYGPMLAGLWNKVHKFGNILYSFDLGLGLPCYRNFFNYLSSPFNIIILFFSYKNVITSYSFVIGLKAVLSSVTMVYFLSKKFNSKKLYLIPFGLLYAFSAYYQSYYWNIMWLDGMVFLPLITLGIENIVNKGTWKFYTFTLSIMLISNYFIGYMICIFSVVYFLCYLIYKTKLRKNWKNAFKEITKKSFKFGYASLLAGGIVAFILIPLFLSMKSISATGGTIPFTQYYDFTLTDFLKGHLTGITTTTFASDDITNPNVSCGILSVALLLLYVLNLDIKLKNKICYLTILSFFILAFFFAPLDYILHAFHVPNDLPYRYSFIYSFVLILISCYSLLNIKKIHYIFVFLSYLFLEFVLLAIINDKWADITTNMIYINMILLTLYFIFYSGTKYINKFHNFLYIGFILIASIDVVISMDNNWDITQVLKIFYQDYESTEKAIDYIKDNDKEKFYRLEKINNMTLNDGSWYYYNGINTFSSMAYEEMAIFQNRLGLPGNNINSYYYTQTTPIYDLMFDLKYTLGNTNDNTRYTTIYNDTQTVNKFDYTVGLVYGVKDDILDWNYTDASPFVIQNDYIEKSTGIKDVFVKPTLLKTEEVSSNSNKTILKYTYENTLDNYYFYENSNLVDFFIIGDTLYYNNSSYAEIIDGNYELNYINVDDYSENNVININSTEDVIKIYVCYDNYYSSTFDLYTIDNNKFEEAYNYLKKYKMDITSFSDSKIEGNITLGTNMYVYTSIPYDKGWKVYVDDKEVETYALADNLLAFDASLGTHKIKIIYTIPYFKISSLISIISALIIIFFNKIEKFIIKHMPKIHFNIKLPFRIKFKKKRKKMSIKDRIRLIDSLK